MKLVSSWLALGGAALVWAAPATGGPQVVVGGAVWNSESAALKGSPEEVASDVLLIRAERVVVRPGVVLEGASVLVRDGIIAAVGRDLVAPEGATEIQGRVVCAGFVDPWSALGLDGGVLSERNTGASTRSVDGLDVFDSPHLRQEALRAGVVAVRLQGGQPAPVGGVGVLVRLDPALDAAGAVLLDDAGIGMAVSLTVAGSGQFIRNPDGSFSFDDAGRATNPFDRVSQIERVVSNIETGRSYYESQLEYRADLEEWEKSIAEKEVELEKDFKKAKKDRDKKVKEAEDEGKEHKDKSYKEDKKPKQPKYDADKEALARVANGEIPLVVEVYRAAEIRNLLKATAEFGRLRLIIAGGAEALHSAKELAERDIPVIVWPSLRGKGGNDEFEGSGLSLAGELSAAGVQVLLGSGGRDAGATRDLPLLASVAVGHGLARDKALEALTIGAARAFDLGDRLGTVEIGKDADLLVLDGAPLVSTTRVQYVISGGRTVVTPEN